MRQGHALRTRHEFREVTVRLLEDYITVLGQSLLELLLEIAATVLILAKRWDLPNKVFETSAGKAVDWSLTSAELVARKD